MQPHFPSWFRAFVVPAGVWLVAFLAIAATRTGRADQAIQDAGWPVNGGVDNIRYSSLAQINRDNVSKLQVAWT
jgi:glucose dehydrogenase